MVTKSGFGIFYFISVMISTFTQSLPLNFFEHVTIQPLDHLTDNHRIKTDKYFVFNYQSGFRGFKAAYPEEALPFFLHHEEVFWGACQLFENLFQHKPDLIRFFHDDEKTWNAFLVTSWQLAKNEEPDVQEWAVADQDPTMYGSWQPEYYVPPMRTRHSQYGKGFEHFPLIGAVNDYGFDKTPAFFYLVATPFRHSLASFLTLANFRFLKDADKIPFARYGTNRKAELARICRDVSKQFKREQQEFDQLLSTMSNRVIESEFFGPVVLDLYNRNRNLESIRNDATLRNAIRITYSQARDFSRSTSELLWSDFIHFIIRYNEFDLEEDWLHSRIIELFKEKRSFKKFEEVFRKFLHNNSRYQTYINDQQSTWELIRCEILEQ